MADTIEVSEDELKIARIGVEIQAEANNLDMSDPNIQAFLEIVIMNSATAAAWERFLQNIIHKESFGGGE